MQVRVRLEKMVELRDILPFHIRAFFVQDRESVGDVGILERVTGWEHFAADDGVDAVPAAPETPFRAKVRGTVDGVEGLSTMVCGVGLALLSRKGFVRQT